MELLEEGEDANDEGSSVVRLLLVSGQHHPDRFVVMESRDLCCNKEEEENGEVIQRLGGVVDLEHGRVDAGRVEVGCQLFHERVGGIGVRSFVGATIMLTYVGQNRLIQNVERREEDVGVETRRKVELVGKCAAQQLCLPDATHNFNKQSGRLCDALETIVVDLETRDGESGGGEKMGGGLSQQVLESRLQLLAENTNKRLDFSDDEEGEGSVETRHTARTQRTVQQRKRLDTHHLSSCEIEPAAACIQI
mmetsp:Transcript_14933/g.35100  ORF Transcript_14933/g.35100 Transcript_14933/m.35100 type:complete len:250 (+) Transcript_14933:269-1018(+)